MYNICRKSTLGIHLNRFKKEFPDHFNFFPQTWVYPADFSEIQEYQRRKEQKRAQKIEDGTMKEAQAEKEPVVLYICKPECGAQGRGIFICSKVDHMRITLNDHRDQQKKEMDQYLKVQ